FLKSGALALVTIGLSPRFLRRATLLAETRAAARGKTLICLFQRGAADALNVLVPFGDPHYYELRPSIAIGAPSRAGGERAIDLDGFFGLHPALSALVPLYQRGMLAPIHAVGSPSSTRSHFDAQDFMETAAPDMKTVRDGWLNRLLASSSADANTRLAIAAGHVPAALRGVALTPQHPRVFDGPAPTVALRSLEELRVRAGGADAARLEQLYQTMDADLVHGDGHAAAEATRVLRSIDPATYVPANGADYPQTDFGRRLRQIAQLVKADVGMEIAFADVGGWDTHVNQGAATGQLANRLDDFGRSVAALVADLGDRMADVVILTMSEFGRMARENGNRGTDHGHAGAMFVIGGAVRGGKVHGRWPGLAPEQLHEGRDLALTTDFRAVFAEVATKHMSAARSESLFPGYAMESSQWLGVL
ncbi:MAG TPA: DUF1501 domain-containing protein, partial [Gemmatimonadaceae bacterium]|nr:DUF1501 domain-containing protein [Gemmatimonadaceae bacterium]